MFLLPIKIYSQLLSLSQQSPPLQPYGIIMKSTEGDIDLLTDIHRLVDVNRVKQLANKLAENQQIIAIFSGSIDNDDLFHQLTDLLPFQNRVLLGLSVSATGTLVIRGSRRIGDHLQAVDVGVE